jgi:hypothetical protein
MRGVSWTLLPALLLAPPASAQDAAAPSLTAEQAMANAAARYTTRPPRPEPCPESSGDVIVVCRQLEEWTGMGLSPTEQAIANGTMPPDPIPQAPDFAGPSTTVVARGCFIPPCPGEPALLIDLKAIPEAPPGSDAARYAGN